MYDIGQTTTLPFYAVSQFLCQAVQVLSSVLIHLFCFEDYIFKFFVKSIPSLLFDVIINFLRQPHGFCYTFFTSVKTPFYIPRSDPESTPYDRLNRSGSYRHCLNTRPPAIYLSGGGSHSPAPRPRAGYDRIL